jgi:hypothetical protein
MKAYTDPVTGWTATYHCKVCCLPYPIQVTRYPRNPCSECGHKSYTRVKPTRQP